uniref:Protein LTV1 homolog n=1 Tax=Phlebotomus papatasi TaxID=29031 RepID=A0A1B0EZN7_PHLPP
MHNKDELIRKRAKLRKTRDNFLATLMGKRRRFIDKKNSVTFHVVNRSQQDPLIADETAPQHVLMEVAPTQKEKQKEDQAKYGIYFDDDYDYLQHLRPRGQVVWECVEYFAKLYLSYKGCFWVTVLKYISSPIKANAARK